MKTTRLNKDRRDDLRPADVAKIRKEYAGGKGVVQIAQERKMLTRHIAAIVSGLDYWRYIP